MWVLESLKHPWLNYSIILPPNPKQPQTRMLVSYHRCILNLQRNKL